MPLGRMLRQSIFSFMLLVVLVPTARVHASQSCSAWKEALNSPAIAKNQEFWAKVAELQFAGKFNDETLKQLVKDFGGLQSATQQVANTTIKNTAVKAGAVLPDAQRSQAVLQIHHQAEKEIARLPSYLRKELNEFTTVLTEKGLHALYSQPGKWRPEKIPELGADFHTIRLNNGYRVLFKEVDGKMFIREVNKSVSH